MVHTLAMPVVMRTPLAAVVWMKSDTIISLLGDHGGSVGVPNPILCRRFRFNLWVATPSRRTSLFTISTSDMTPIARSRVPRLGRRAHGNPPDQRSGKIEPPLPASSARGAGALVFPSPLTSV